MEHIELSDKEIERLIDLLSSENQEDHIVATNIIVNNLNQYNTIVDKMNFTHFFNFRVATHKINNI